MRICVTTSDNYHHLLPIFFYLYNKYWGEPFDLVGHAKPECELPGNCTWVSLGEQLGKEKWSDQLRPYFEQQPDWFIWMMEDTFIKDYVETENLDCVPLPTYQLLGTFGVGRVDLTGDILKRPHKKFNDGVLADERSRYRLSTQPSVWGKRFLLKYLTNGLSPWDFETQDPMCDDFIVCGWLKPKISHNEGVRRHDIYKLNLDGMKQEDIDHIKTLITW